MTEEKRRRENLLVGADVFPVLVGGALLWWVVLEDDLGNFHLLVL